MSKFLMAHGKPPFVLLPPFLRSGRGWHDVIPYLSSHHEVYTPTLLGHCGGPSVQRHPATITDVIDAAERFLDDQRLERPHLVGNSTGGYVAIELARRGRAATVCALSPAGFWSIGDGSDTRAANKVRRIPSGARAVELLGDIVACTVDVHEVHDEHQIAPLDPLPCPITLAWSGKDSLFPAATYGRVARERLPRATFKMLPDVGHTPMADDPGLVARTI